MKKLICLIVFAAQLAFGYYPHASVGGSEIIGDLQEGLLIPMPDFVFDGTKTDKGSPCLRYRSRLFPQAEFVFVRDVFDYSFYLEDYAAWFTQADAHYYPIQDSSLFYGGADGCTPMLMQWWENYDSYYFQLYFGRGFEGFCCFVYLPKLCFDGELSYWLNLFETLPSQIQMVNY